MREFCICVSNDNENVTPIETIDAIKKADFRNVFIQWYDKDFSPSQKQQLDYIKESGLNISFAHLGYQNINDIWFAGESGEGFVNRFCKDIADCRENGISRIVMHLQGKSKELPYGPIGFNRLQKIVDYAKELGVDVSFENTKLQSALDATFSNVVGDNVGFCYDVGHNHCNFNDSINLENYRNKIFEVHLHDNHGNFTDEHLLPFDGTIDWHKEIKKIAVNGYKREITLEVCYRNEYMNKYSIDQFYNEAYRRAMRIAEMFDEYAK